ncbi:unnamed protein product (macronuclear) [Paramecium tetraurelia]|uniref:LITAF domain-containing protein n=1 Tax=Paramecium tetraurelia TaxID=5888 RepID=A0E5U6_PARTE|nr:uncharacterized protein GSPATT00003525001 [Paramecium tetraurelia]CAK90663.1 unnamed protein product [Paramecium tetraurelia]|eukprot:XP_001458060.1 hypothetical protein (macronuclear) [Paramecium tetraurelia strain d4-2]
MQTDQDNSSTIIAPVIDEAQITIDSDDRQSQSLISVNYHANMKRVPITVVCPQCKQQGTTVIIREVGAATIMVGYLLFLLTTIFCFWIPCCVDECQDAIHQCPHCKAEVGIGPYQIL